MDGGMSCRTHIVNCKQIEFLRNGPDKIENGHISPCQLFFELLSRMKYKHEAQASELFLWKSHVCSIACASCSY